MRKYNDIVINHFGSNEEMTRYEFYQFVNQELVMKFEDSYAEIQDKTKNYKVLETFTGNEET